MESNSQENKKIPFEKGLKYLEAAGQPRGRVFKYKVFLKLFMDLVESSSFPVTVTKKYQQDDLVSADTMLYVMCNANDCSTRFNVSIVKLFDDYLNYGICCPKCRLKQRNKMLEMEKKVLERDSQYADINPYASEAFSYEDPDLYIKRKTVEDKETGLFTTVERTPAEIKAFKQELAREKQELLDIIKNNPEAYEKLRKKRKEIEGRSKRFRKEAMINALNNDFELRVDTESPGGYGGGKTPTGVSVENTHLSLDERIVRSSENSTLRTTLSDKGYDDLDDIIETYGENISRDKIWDSIAQDMINAATGEYTGDDGNIHDQNLDFKLNSDL